ncbi:MAG: leucyl aminopeptidase family protein [Candidatus Dormibacterales bacterium]
MKVSLAGTRPSDTALDALAIPVAAGRPLSGPSLELDRKMGGLLSEMLAGAEFRGELFELTSIPTQNTIQARRVILYGVGALADLDGQRLRAAHHELVRAARRRRYRRLGVLCADPLDTDSLKAVVEGCVMGTFERRSRQTWSDAGPESVDELVLLGFGLGREREVVAAHENGDATNFARVLQNAPPNELTPYVLAQEATRIAERHHLELEVLGPEELRAAGYNLLLGVASGSSQPPRLITLRHPAAAAAGGGPANRPVLALVGKGITFDSGGISLKNPENMSQMKADMAGAAAVLASIDVIAARNLPLDVLAVVAATENMPGPSAQRPGDVVVSAAGKTVEVVNTDAEGRLVLADALTHALRKGATHVLDLATLTGAATIAIGHSASAAVSNDDGFWLQVAGAALAAGDRVWRLPIIPDLKVLLQSKIADLRNAEYGEAGSILGGMFIGEFAGGKPWAHLDIAASSWNTNLELTTVIRGPSGAGTRICIELAELMALAAS